MIYTNDDIGVCRGKLESVERVPELGRVLKNILMLFNPPLGKLNGEKRVGWRDLIDIIASGGVRNGIHLRREHGIG